MQINNEIVMLCTLPNTARFRLVGQSTVAREKLGETETLRFRKELFQCHPKSRGSRRSEIVRGQSALTVTNFYHIDARLP